MILALDIGNTAITLGCYQKDSLAFISRITTDPKKMEDQYAVDIRDILAIYDTPAQQITGSIISSVVPPLTDVVARAVEKITHTRPMVVGPGIKTGLNIRIDNPATLGADLVADCVAALEYHALPCIILDLGTATSISVLDSKGVMIGGALMPGVHISLEALCKSTAQLPNIALTPPKRTIGTNTIDCMASGTLLGTASMLDGMCLRIEEELGSPCTVIGTGGMAQKILPLCRRAVIHDENLLLNGLYILYQKNSQQKPATTA